MSHGILIVEDNPTSGKMLELLLRKYGYRPLLTQTGREALACLRGGADIQLVIADIMMPGMNGLELLRLLKAEPAWERLPVIMVTALADVHTIHQAFALGCRHYLVKPITARQVLQKLQETLGREVPVLRDPLQVMQELGLDRRAYDEVAAAFSKTVAGVIAGLAQGQAAGPTGDRALDLRDLWEGAALLGAERVLRLLDRGLLSPHGAGPDGAALRQELQRVHDALTASSCPQRS